jgi:rare lipoprotein A
MRSGRHHAVLLAAAIALGAAVSPDPPRRQVGIASWYGWAHQGRRTASGRRFDARAYTAASLSIPLGTRVRVCLCATVRCVHVQITDRGPYVKGRVIDLSFAAARALGIRHQGLARVVITEEPR